MRVNIVCSKVGMTQIFDEGRVVPVTVLRFGSSVVVGKKTEDRDGYCALILGFGEAKEKTMRKSELGLFSKAGVDPRRVIMETRVQPQELDQFEVGQEVTIDHFQKGDFIDVTGKTKGRGFTGVMKRHGMAGAKRSHGTHEYFRHGGSIGASAYPARVFKGKKMPGRYGGTQVTVQNLVVADVMPDKNVILVKGAVPGPNGASVTVSHAKKRTA